MSVLNYGYVQVASGDSAEIESAFRSIVASNTMFGDDRAFMPEALEFVNNVIRAGDVGEYAYGTWARSAICVHDDRNHGLKSGDLVTVYDYPHVNRNGWTMHVKAKIVSVKGRHTVVRITGDSFQFDRYSTVSVPTNSIIPRK